MKNDKINSLESLAREEFLAKDQFVPSPAWQNEVISDIKRREHAGKFNKNIQPQPLLQPRLVWRFAAAFRQRDKGSRDVHNQNRGRRR